MSEYVKKVFDSDEISMFCEQIALLLNGGISVNNGIYMLYSDMEDAKTKAVLKQIDDQVQQNEPLYKALAATGAFPDYMVHMVHVGEKTGRLEDVMKSLAEYYERDSRVKSGIRSAVAYPLILFAVMAGIMVVLAWKILPMFERMFEELNSDVAGATQNVLSVGLNAGRVIAAVICVLFVFAAFVIIWGRTKSGAHTLLKLADKIKPIRKLMVLMATGKFISSMSLMTASGKDVADALEHERDNCDNAVVKGRIETCLNLYDEGAPLNEAVRKSELLTGMEARLFTVADNSGETDEILQKLGERYNEKITAALGKLTTVIETVLVIVLSVMVGAVLLSVMLPLVNMISAIA